MLNDAFMFSVLLCSFKRRLWSLEGGIKCKIIIQRMKICIPQVWRISETAGLNPQGLPARAFHLELDMHIWAAVCIMQLGAVSRKHSDRVPLSHSTTGRRAVGLRLPLLPHSPWEAVSCRPKHAASSRGAATWAVGCGLLVDGCQGTSCPRTVISI